MSTHMLVTLVGQDRPGLVEVVARTIAEHGGNWLESQLARLGGQFAGMVRVDIAGADDGLVGALHALPGLKVIVSESDDAPSAGDASHQVSVVGTDRAGIVRDVAAAIAASGVNVESLDTWTDAAPMSGEAMFYALALVSVADEAQLDAMQDRLEALSDDLMVDVMPNLEEG